VITRIFVLWAVVVGQVHGQSGRERHSALWGATGEAWNPAGRLPDVSFAGYASGEKPLPNFPVTANVRDFGAKGDGTTDDSAAFLTAISNVKSGAILIPPGRYLIRQILEITKPEIVLRGAGPDQSILVCDTPLNDIKPDWGATTSGIRTSNYSWSGGIVWFKGGQPGKKIGTPSHPALRGDRELRIQGDLSRLNPGDWVEIRLRDDAEKSLLHHLYSGDPGNLSKIPPSQHSTSFLSRIKTIDGQKLTLDRPLRVDLRPEWNPQLVEHRPTVTHSGIENLAFEFPERKYGGHFSELGFNAVAFNGVAHCWAHNLVITNSDSGIFLGGRFCTASDIVFRLSQEAGVFGHHGVTLSGHDNLLTRFDIRQRFIHDISFERGAGNVASAGSGIDLCFDHHKRAPYDNVATDIDLGLGTRMWTSGGGANLGRHCAAHGTFWNIRAKKPQKHPGDFGPPTMNLVAVATEEASITDKDGIWLEAILPAEIRPANLHEAQLARRLSNKN
jgi:hypothetical protein